MGSAVLIVHGEEPLRATAREALELAGHAVREANELSVAWRLLELARPDLIILPWTALKPIRDSLARLRDEDKTRLARISHR